MSWSNLHPIPVILVMVMAAAGAHSQGGAKSPAASTHKPAVKTTAAAVAPPVTVNDLAVKPDAHLGKVTLVGVVASAKPKSGFVLIDSREYKKCGLSCLTEPGTRKIPVRWTGAAPRIKESVNVEGTMEKTRKGYTFTARKLRKK